MHRHGFDAQLAAGAQDAKRNLAAIRDDDFFDHLGACLSIPRGPRWLGEGADARRAAQAVVVLRSSRATPQTPLSQPTRRDQADFPSFIVVASLLGLDPTASAPPRLRGNLPRSRPRRMLRQAPRAREARRGFFRSRSRT